MSLRILSLQPFYGGSHRAFIDGWIQNSEHEWTQLTLPDRHWKWRMRHSAIRMTDQLWDLDEANPISWDVMFATDMLNVAEFKGLLPSKFSRVPLVTYFHENQFEYPNRNEDPRDVHFAFTNLTTCLASDEVWFNSAFNRDSMLREIELMIPKWPDFAPQRAVEKILAKSRIEAPGIEIRPLPIDKPGGSIHLLWAARFEHDKNPDEFLDALRILRRDSVPFRLSVIGKTYRQVPDSLIAIKNEFTNQIVDWGWQESREDYFSAVGKCDVFCSTALHEFFGLAAAEAISLGVYPLMPRRLAYPELVADLGEKSNEHLYDGNPENLASRIRELAAEKERIGRLELDSDWLASFRTRFGWPTRSQQMDHQIANTLAISD